ncbi:MED7 protein-domain-containing protein [Truncatella angustata]|uniref:Mediator of RNA polymerase II transcription subunit 7 n=1 Tax=Truncatella angustata TaxID=152316 RepID=A0A9P8RL66_9PEZI|nr:MED7 protein-domain-containing protein [Truncatella angustata]KAH6645176.1 MED7 protein-domain-containing protein [Truncatella angustata]
MADDNEAQNAISSTYPAPPPFWKDFTPDNVARIADLRQEQAERQGITDSTTVRLSGLPENLGTLQPPPEPEDGTWRVFGQNYALKDELPRLEDGTGIRKLFPDPEERDQDGKHFDRATILKRLAKSLLLNFLELTGILATDPAAAEEKITDIRDLFLNFHHLINEYRPHQARESLISTMQAQLDRTRAETNAIRHVKENVERLLEGLGSLKMDDDDDDAPNGTGDAKQPVPNRGATLDDALAIEYA